MANPLRIFLIALALIFALSAAAGSTQQTGRYILKHAGDGFVRLDTRTGSLAHCLKIDGKWQCESLDTGKSVHSTEIAQLKQQNKNLTNRVARLEAKLRELSGETRKPKSKLGLPSDQELDEIMGFFEKLVMRFMQFARTLQDAPGEDI